MAYYRALRADELAEWLRKNNPVVNLTDQEAQTMAQWMVDTFDVMGHRSTPL